MIGATPTSRKIGNIIIENLFGEGYRGKVFLVNPNYKGILGMPCYPSVLHCPDVPGHGHRRGSCATGFASDR